MKITHLSPTSAVGSTVGRTDSAPKEKGRAESAKVVAPEIQSGKLVEALTQASDVDMSKVNEVRQAILEGRLSLDPEALAEAVLAMHQR